MSVLYIRDVDGSFIQIPAIPGKSAYQIAIEKGVFSGTEQEFAKMLVFTNKEILEKITQEDIDKWNLNNGEDINLSGYVTKEDFDSLEKIETSDTEPTDEDIFIWINTSEDTANNPLARINDNTIARNTTWSSEKIDDIIKNIDSSQIDLSEYATKDELFSKDYNDLINKPTIPSINGLATEGYVNDYVENAIKDIPKEEVDLSEYAKKEELFSKDYNDLTNKPTIPSIEGLASESYINEAINSLEKIETSNVEPTEESVSIWIDTSETMEIEEISRINDNVVADNTTWSSEKINDVIKNIDIPKEEIDLGNYATKDELFSKDYNDLINKPTIPSIEGLASENYVNETINSLEKIETSNTEPTDEDISIWIDISEGTEIEEISRINDNVVADNVTWSSEKILEEMNNVVPQIDLSNYATKNELFSKDYNDLTNKPTIPSIEGLASEEYVENEIADVISSTEAINSSNTQPTKENVSIWINTSEDTATNPLTRINDDTIAKNTTWSSEKIDNTIKNNLISSLKLIKEGNTIKLMLGDIELSNISID